MGLQKRFLQGLTGLLGRCGQHLDFYRLLNHADPVEEIRARDKLHIRQQGNEFLVVVGHQVIQFDAHLTVIEALFLENVCQDSHRRLYKLGVETLVGNPSLTFNRSLLNAAADKGRFLLQRQHRNGQPVADGGLSHDIGLRKIQRILRRDHNRHIQIFPSHKLLQPLISLACRHFFTPPFKFYTTLPNAHSKA